MTNRLEEYTRGPEGNIIGITLMKCFPDVNGDTGKTNYRRMIGFLAHLRHVINGRDADGRRYYHECPNYDRCRSEAHDADGETYCSSLTIEEFSTMMGHFDFIIQVRSTKLEAVEGFWLNCLRQASRHHFKGNIISDTQTLLGVSPSTKILKDCLDEFETYSKHNHTA